MKRLLLENISLKAAALMLAVLLWLFVSSKGQTETALNVPIEYVNIPSGLEISKHTVKSVNIVIRGHESLLKNVRQGDVRVSVDVSRAKEGEETFALKKDDIAIPNSATVTRMEPSAVKVVFEKTATRRVAVRPVVTGEPESGYYVRSVEVRPKEVLIEGARSEVSRVGYLKTEPIDITGMAGDFGQEAELALSGRNIRTRTDKVDVRIKIARRGR